MKLLIIDDDEEVRLVARVALERVGQMQVVEAGTGARGLELARSEQPGAILLDVNLPDMDAEEVLSSIRRDEVSAHIPVVLLTASHDTAVLSRLAELGASTVVRKPFDPLRLASQIRRTCGEHQRAVGLAATLRVLRERFLEGTGARLERLDEALNALAREPSSPVVLDRLRGEFHSMAGAAGCYGLQKASDYAATAEADCIALMTSDSPPASSAIKHLGEEIQSIRRALSPANSEPSTSDAVAEHLESVVDREAPPALALVADEDSEMLQELEVCLRKQGLAVAPARTQAEAMRAIASDRPPDAVITAVALEGGSGLELIRQLRALPGGGTVPVLVTSKDQSISERAEALRCGASACIPKPYNPVEIAARLVTLLTRRASRNNRILHIEDDVDQADYVRALLESAGYSVCSCSGTEEFDQALYTFQPDLLLLDLDLQASVDGLDLTRALRQDEATSALPIVHLTSRCDGATRIAAVEAGGDDLLTKPVEPEVLLSHVAARLERSRHLRGLMEQDGLTKLLNHVALMDAVEACVERHGPNGPSCALVMLDIDHFKNVNDTHGHVVGDHVIQGLAGLLRSQFRHSDVIGRYGGEEFAVLLINISEEDALRLTNVVREECARKVYVGAEGAEFRSTFSAGLAMLSPDIPDAEQWVRDADSALYAAKVAGRNRVLATSAKLEAADLNF